MPSLPSSARLFVFAVLLPAAVAGTNQLLFELILFQPSLRAWLYPWMAFTTALLSWCVGRFLSPVWLRLIVFTWCLALLDLLTAAACLDRYVESHFGYLLVSSQISLIVLWAVLSTANWQWRMPVVLITAAAVIVFSGSFYATRRDYWDWNLLMLLATAVIVLLCGTIRLSGFVLERPTSGTLTPDGAATLKIHQFGIKHMLIWATAIVPVLLVMRGLNFLVLRRLGGPDLFPLFLVALSVAIVNLIAIWAVLGHGYWISRLTAIVVIPYLLAHGMDAYLDYIESTYRFVFPSGVQGFRSDWDESLVRDVVVDVRDSWPRWLWLNATLLAALLLFLRASGYWLTRRTA